MAPQPRLSPYAHSADAPPRDIEADAGAVSDWYRDVFGAVAMLGPDPTMTPRERELHAMSGTDYVAARRAGTVSCEEYTTALVKRARYLRYMNHFIFNTYDRLDQAVAAAVGLDATAEAEGVEAIAPLYGLPIPMKGTAAVVDYPSGSGSGVLSGYTPVKDSGTPWPSWPCHTLTSDEIVDTDLTALIKEKNGIILGCTNVPEFAASARTVNPASGQTRNAYSHALTVGGSSGGAGSAVASYVAPIAVTEDTGGSTRIPATANGNFGFDPSRGHYPNDGNPGMSYIRDQLGLNARSEPPLLSHRWTLRNSATQSCC